jgi:hypothetical protein
MSMILEFPFGAVVSGLVIAFGFAEVALIRAGRELRLSLRRLEPSLEPQVFPRWRMFALLLPMPGFSVSAVLKSAKALSARHPSLDHLVRRVRVLNRACVACILALFATFAGFALTSGL